MTTEIFIYKKIISHFWLICYILSTDFCLFFMQRCTITRTVFFLHVRLMSENSNIRNFWFDFCPKSQFGDVTTQYKEFSEASWDLEGISATTPEDEFLNVIGTKVLRVSSLLFKVTSTNGFYSPSTLSKSRLKLFWNVSIVYGNL